MVPKRVVYHHFMPFLIEYEYRRKDYKKANPTETKEKIKRKSNIFTICFLQLRNKYTKI